MHAIKYAAVALVSAPFVLIGLLMIFRGFQARALAFAAAGMFLVAMMSASALMAIDNLTVERIYPDTATLSDESRDAEAVKRDARASAEARPSPRNPERI